uniref:RNA-directed RNA polymerase catalytic subunit n=1 Tax=Angiostrongylus costaricensis TaxID=334426 RepID=A0A0R3PBE2_ANGCS
LPWFSWYKSSNQSPGKPGLPTRYIKVFRSLYENFTNKTSPYYTDINIFLKRGVSQGDLSYPKLFSATIENVMQTLEQDSSGVKTARRMVSDFDETCGKIGARLYLTKTMVIEEGLLTYASFTLNGTNISECSSYAFLARAINVMNSLTPELSRRKRTAWGAFKSIEDILKKTKNTRFRPHLFDLTTLPALTYAPENWPLCKRDKRSPSIIEGACKGRYWEKPVHASEERDPSEGSPDLCQPSQIRNAFLHAKMSKIKWAGHQCVSTTTDGIEPLAIEFFKMSKARHSDCRANKHSS